MTTNEQTPQMQMQMITDDEQRDPITGLTPSERDAARRAFTAKKLSRIERLEARAEKQEEESDRAYKAAHGIADMIPLGQPILVGHYSEKRHRRDIDKIQNNMRKSVEASKYAKALRERIAAAEANDAIRSDDPDAIDALLAKIEQAEANHELMVAVNKVIKNKKLDEAAKREQLAEFGYTDAQITRLMTPDYLRRVGFPDYALTNDSANIRRMKKRVEELKARNAMKPVDETIGDVRMWDDVIENRLKLEFPGKPDEDTRKALRHAGFVWSPTNRAWQRMRSASAQWRARKILNALAGIETSPIWTPESRDNEEMTTLEDNIAGNE